MNKIRFNGSDYNPALDDKRLTKQLGKIYSLMIDHKWRTLAEISKEVDEPEASVSAQLRHLRKERFGSYVVNKHRRGEPGCGLFEYQVLDPETKKQEQLSLTF